MTEAVESPKAKKKETVYTEVQMEDGRTQKFPGDQRVKKSVLREDGVAVGTQFDFRNGRTLNLMLSELSAANREHAACHGLIQKIGDEFSGTKEVEDMVLEGETLIERLRGEEGSWGVEREAGDSMAGASIVIRALMEATGKDVGTVKKFLDDKLERAKAEGQKLTRQALYASFRNPTSKVGQIIRRMEEEKASKSTAVDADATMNELLEV